MSPTPPPRRAATIILGRPARAGDGGAFEVLLVKRHGKSGFMAGAHVFPGGRVDDADADAAADLLAADLLAAGAPGGGAGTPAFAATWHDAGGAPLAPLEAATYAVCAVRETKEEAGIDVDARALLPWSWWITPEEEPKRFDTRFFIAAVPASAVAVVDEHEAVAFAWLSPPAALAAYARGDIVLAPPTLATLEDLAPYASVDEAARAVRAPVRPVCPKIVSGADGLVLALPGDPLHAVRERVFPGRTRIVMNAAGRFESAAG